MSLVPSIVQSVNIPVIAAGGIMNGNSIAAALMLGASAVQMGTAFLVCKEAGTNRTHKDAVLKATEESTVITNAFTGRKGRGLGNDLIATIERNRENISDWGQQISLVSPITTKATKEGNSKYMQMFAGQGARLAREMSASELVSTLNKEYKEAISFVKN